LNALVRPMIFWSPMSGAFTIGNKRNER
jgi:hypothetical protein